MKINKNHSVTGSSEDQDRRRMDRRRRDGRSEDSVKTDGRRRIDGRSKDPVRRPAFNGGVAEVLCAEDLIV